MQQNQIVVVNQESNGVTLDKIVVKQTIACASDNIALNV